METARIQIIFGKTGTGKTTLVKELIKNKSRVVIIDALAEYDNGVVCNNFEDFFEYINTHSSFFVCCRFTESLDVEYAFKIINNVQNICLIVEEAEIYINPQAQASNFLYLCRYGRHTNIEIIAIARRSAELSTNLKALCNRIISFRQTLPRDLQSLDRLGLYGLENLKLFNYETDHIPKENIHYKVCNF